MPDNPLPFSQRRFSAERQGVEAEARQAIADAIEDRFSYQPKLRALLTSDDILSYLDAAGFCLVREGEAVLDGEVVRFVRWSDSLLQVNRLPND